MEEMVASCSLKGSSQSESRVDLSLSLSLIAGGRQGAKGTSRGLVCPGS